MNQQILKSNLKIIYNEICQNWKNTLNEYLLWSEGKYVEIPEELLKKGYKEANDKQKKLIEKYFKIEKPKGLLKEIKDFNDILKISGKTLKDILIYPNPKTKKEIRLNAFNKIELIKEVLNGEWEEDWNNGNQYKYYPYFTSRVGFAFDVCGLCSYDFGSVVAFYKSKEIAEFVGKTFLKEYKEFATGKIEK